MTPLDSLLVKLKEDVKELNARFTDEGQRTERRRQIMLQEARISNTPDHMNHAQLVKPESEEEL